MAHKVIKIIDGDTLDVSPKWRFKGKTGNRVRLSGINAPEIGKPGASAAKERLKKRFMGKSVKLDGKALSYGRLVAKVTLA